MLRRLVLASVAALLLAAPSLAKLECRQPNYVTHDGKIWAQDPATPGTETEVTIRGVSWSGMDKENMIPDGLWGTTSINNNGIRATKMSTLLEFFTNNSINSVRLPLNAEYVIANPLPQLAYIHNWDNRELTTWADPNTVTYFDLLGRVIQTLQTNKVSVLLDIHLLTNYLQDAYWYTAPYVAIEQSPTYQAVEYLAKAFCNETYWNVLGIDLKDEMSEVMWNDDAASADLKTDWHGAAQVLANHVLSICPSWLVFVGGASSPTPFQQFSVGDKYAPSNHWDGGNLHNATKNALNVTLANKIVFAPHAHTHGRLPQNYFYSADSNCTDASPSDYYGFEAEQKTPECVDFIDGVKTKSKISCSTTEFGCSSYKHLTSEQIVANYKKVIDEAMGDVVKAAATPVVFGALSGVYDAAAQPHQTAALDFLIDYAATTLRGGYFWSLNPDMEYFLEDSTNNGSGLFGKTHFGIFKPTSWQEPQTALLEALAKIPSSEMPCYGGKSSPGGQSGARGGVAASAGFAVMGAALAATAFLAVRV